MSLKLQSFGPIADKHSRVLVLGTMPGAMSLAKRQYYGHPRNAFWPIMARLCDRELPEDYALRKAMLLDAGIALWDVCGECEREGSLDSNICHEKPNRIDELLRSYPSTARSLSTDRAPHDCTGNTSAARLGIRSADPAFDQPRPCRRVR